MGFFQDMKMKGTYQQSLGAMKKGDVEKMVKYLRDGAELGHKESVKALAEYYMGTLEIGGQPATGIPVDLKMGEHLMSLVKDDFLDNVEAALRK
jgi:hypothetical protein